MKAATRGGRENSREGEKLLILDVILNERGRGVYIALGCLGRRPRSSPERQDIFIHTFYL